MVPRIESKSWCFTLNNYTDDEVSKINNIECEYVIYGYEVGENGTPHLQGTICFKKKKAFNSVKLLISDRCHLEKCNALDASIDYCKKEGNYIERGTKPLKKAGERNDIKEVTEYIKANNLVTLAELRDMFAEQMAKYGQYFERVVQDNRPTPVIKTHPLRSWQQHLYDKLKLPPSDREIIFVVDAEGNSGKSWFADYYQMLHPNDEVFPQGRKDNITYAMSAISRVIFFDYPRSVIGTDDSGNTTGINYPFLEEIKNGRVFMQKYESRVKRFLVPHVVVLMNQNPDMNKLSRDRYCVIDVKDFD